jgi:hypothetical protein
LKCPTLKTKKLRKKGKKMDTGILLTLDKALGHMFY